MKVTRPNVCEKPNTLSYFDGNQTQYMRNFEYIVATVKVLRPSFSQPSHSFKLSLSKEHLTVNSYIYN